MNTTKRTAIGTTNYVADNKSTITNSLEDSVKFQMDLDSKTKKSAIYHPPVKSKRAHPMSEKADYVDKCGDLYQIKLGYPMTWGEYNQISDDGIKRQYIESMFDKYPGIGCTTLCNMFGIKYQHMKFEINRLGITIPNTNTSTNLKHQYDVEVNEILKDINAGKKPSNLVIVRKNEIGKVKRLSYTELKELKDCEAKLYLESVASKYNNAIGVGDFSELLGCSELTTRKYFKRIGFKATSRGYAKSNRAKVDRDRFKAEMLNKISKEKKEELKKEFTSSLQTTPSFSLNSIEVITDVNDIKNVLDSFGITGKVKIKVERM